MRPKHVSILKANRGELVALTNLHVRTVRKFLPLFEIGRLTDAIRKRNYIKNSQTPMMTFIDRALDGVGKAWSSRLAMVDGYQWPAQARVENGDHVIAYIAAGLRARGVSVIPVIGYDRWDNAAYRLGLQSIPARDDGHYCLRLDASAIEDAADPEHFMATINEIIEDLELEPSACSVLIDFADISMDAMPIETLSETAEAIIEQLIPIGFKYYVVAGCSLPKSIDLAVSSRDSSGMVLRKEMLTWQMLRLGLPNLQIVSGDYGVRGPTTTEAPSKNTNGKIRHTIKLQTYVERGHAFTLDHSNIQMRGLASKIVNSKYYPGENFSWGDQQINICNTDGAFGNAGTWIAIDTNHHITFVVQEVEEFELEVVAKSGVSSDAVN